MNPQHVARASFGRLLADVESATCDFKGTNGPSASQLTLACETTALADSSEMYMSAHMCLTD
jgi:hypothetical protein